jgi:hypothetical protein
MSFLPVTKRCCSLGCAMRGSDQHGGTAGQLYPVCAGNAMGRVRRQGTRCITIPSIMMAARWPIRSTSATARRAGSPRKDIIADAVSRMMNAKASASFASSRA